MTVRAGPQKFKIAEKFKVSDSKFQLSIKTVDFTIAKIDTRDSAHIN